MKSAFLLLALLVSACAHYVPQPVSAEAGAESLRARSLDAPAVRALVEPRAGPWPPPQWTPELLGLAAVALHPDLDVARAQWSAARAAIRTASERPNPSAAVGIEHKNEARPWTTTLSFDVPVETAGKRGARIDEAHALSVAAAADLDQAVREVRTRALAAALDLGASRELARVRGDEVRLRDEIVSMLERRLEVGEAAQPEVTRVRADARASRLALTEEQTRTQEREAALAATIGVPRDALPPFSVAEMPEPADLRLRALTQRPDVLAALARYDAAEAALRLEVRKQYPDVHLGPGLGWDQGAFKWIVGASAEIPLFNRHEGPIAEVEARRAVAGAELLALQSRILGALESALASEAGARERLSASDRSLEQVRALAASSRRRFEAGEIDRLALRSEELELALAEADRWNAWFDLQRARVALEAAGGE